MPYIKKLIMQGFKSFARKTEIPFTKEMNLIVGPNGSGKSNIADALCFVLGRLSIKSIRAAKAANLLFTGNKTYKPSHEAIVELIFDNSDKSFTLNTNEISIKRIVRRNGQSIYRINHETKTRQELLELLAQAGIDPHGFNIVLQGEIDSLIKINSEERRKIIEEVAGISIYETRKQKSLREFEKTEEKLKEVSTVVRERNAYLKNLDKERQEALNYQKLGELLKRCKATIFYKQIKDKESETGALKKIIERHQQETEKLKKEIREKERYIQEIEGEIKKINKSLQESTTKEQEKIHNELSDLKAREAGLTVKKENLESRIKQNSRKVQEIKEKIHNLEGEISELNKSTPKIKERQETLKEGQNKFEILEKKRKRFYQIKFEISSFENRKSEKQKESIELKKEQEIIEDFISRIFEEVKSEKSIEKLIKLKQETIKKMNENEYSLKTLNEKYLEVTKQELLLKKEQERNQKLKQDIVKLDVCPLCKNKITKEHITHVIENSNKFLEEIQREQEQNLKDKEKLEREKREREEALENIRIELNKIDADIIKLNSADDKKEHLKKIAQHQTKTNEELKEINEKLNFLKKEQEKIKNIEEEYDEMRLKLQEFSFQDIDVDTDVAIKQKELNRLKLESNSISRDIDESKEQLNSTLQELEEIEETTLEKEREEKGLYERYQTLFEKRNNLQDRQKTIEAEIIGIQHNIKSHEEKINFNKIQQAQCNAQLDSFKEEFKEFEGFEILQLSIEKTKERLLSIQQKLSQIGNVNLRSLEIYEKIKQQCDEIEIKMKIIEGEKEKILKIIEEIDKKKKKSFIKTLESVNEYFTRNFSQLSKKGEVFLDLENKQEPFSGGLNILLKVARGKYFDVSSLSGGEKAIVALSLIFAIQEYKPYCFYIFDEIDAALDKNNSERLAALIKKYMTSGQYIIITHNDALISEATTLYGVSMQENISNVISLKI